MNDIAVGKRRLVRRVLTDWRFFFCLVLCVKKKEVWR